VLSSHLLDEVQRTCNAVAIVDRGRVVRQGTIEDLLQATNVGLQIECDQVDRALQIVSGMQDVGGVRIVSNIQAGAHGLGVSLTQQSNRDHVAEMNRRLVGAGISVYQLQPVRASLEEWFLSVTTPLGAEHQSGGSAGDGSPTNVAPAPGAPG
jgi:ABC-2 type transport system ATP-binding protein